MTDTTTEKPTRRQAPGWIALGVFAVVVLLAAVLVAQRRAVARSLIDARLRALGFEEVEHVVERFGIAEFGVRDFRIGSGEDLVVDRIHARYTPSSLLAGRLEDLSVRGVRLRGTIGADGVSLGVLDPLLRREAGEAGGSAPAAALPAANIEIEDVDIRLETPRGPLALAFAAQVTDSGAGGIAASATLTARHALLDASATIELHGTLEEFAGDASLELNAAGEIGSGAELEPTAVALAAEFTYSDERMGVAVEPAPFAIAVHRGGETFRIEGETPALSLAMPSTRNGRAPAIHVSTSGGRVQLPDGGFEVRDLAVDADVPPDTGLPSGSLRIGTLVDLGAPARLAELALSAEFSATSTDVDFDVTLTNAGREIVLTARGSHDAATGGGEAHVALEPLVFAADGLQPAALSPALGALVDLASGSVEVVRGEVAWGGEEAIRGGLVLKLRDLSVSMEQAGFENLHADIRVNGPWPLSTPPDQLVYIAGMDVGLQLINGVVAFELRPDGVLDLASAEWPFAGGMIRTRGAADLTAETQKLVLQLADVDLSELLALVDLGGLEGTGRVEGRIPVVWNGRTLEIHSGKLSTTGAGGWVGYRPEGGLADAASREQDVNTLLAALENFHYNVIVITLDGDAFGEVEIGIHLAGANPDYLEGRTFEVSFNVEAPFKSLLRYATVPTLDPAEIERLLRAKQEGSR